MFLFVCRTKNGAFMPMMGPVKIWRDWAVEQVYQWCKDSGFRDISKASLKDAVTP